MYVCMYVYVVCIRISLSLSLYIYIYIYISCTYTYPARRGNTAGRLFDVMMAGCTTIYTYEEFTRLAETRLARNTSNYISIA